MIIAQQCNLLSPSLPPIHPKSQYSLPYNHKITNIPRLPPRLLHHNLQLSILKHNLHPSLINLHRKPNAPNPLPRIPLITQSRSSLIPQFMKSRCIPSDQDSSSFDFDRDIFLWGAREIDVDGVGVKLFKDVEGWVVVYCVVPGGALGLGLFEMDVVTY